MSMTVHEKIAAHDALLKVRAKLVPGSAEYVADDLLCGMIDRLEHELWAGTAADLMHVAWRLADLSCTVGPFAELDDDAVDRAERVAADLRRLRAGLRRAA